MYIAGQYVCFLREGSLFYDLAAEGILEADWQAEVDVFMLLSKERKRSMADATPYCYLYDLITGRHGERESCYVFVDEI